MVKGKRDGGKRGHPRAFGPAPKGFPQVDGGYRPDENPIPTNPPQGKGTPKTKPEED